MTEERLGEWSEFLRSRRIAVDSSDSILLGQKMRDFLHLLSEEEEHEWCTYTQSCPVCGEAMSASIVLLDICGTSKSAPDDGSLGTCLHHFFDTFSEDQEEGFEALFALHKTHFLSGIIMEEPDSPRAQALRSHFVEFCTMQQRLVNEGARINPEILIQLTDPGATV